MINHLQFPCFQHFKEYPNLFITLGYDSFQKNLSLVAFPEQEEVPWSCKRSSCSIVECKICAPDDPATSLSELSDSQEFKIINKCLVMSFGCIVREDNVAVRVLIIQSMG